MPTDKYTMLQNRITKLRRVYLPRTFSPTGSYTDAAYEKVRAYKVLAHAEMEFYFEQTALSIAQKAMELWTTQRRASIPLLAMIAYHDGQLPNLPDRHVGNNVESDIDWRIQRAYTQYNTYVRSSNHGIKEKNIISLFLPIGVRISELDEGMLLALNNFGTDRGAIAHSTRVNTLTDPRDAFNTVTNILVYIEVFDSFLQTFEEAIT